MTWINAFPFARMVKIVLCLLMIPALAGAITIVYGIIVRDWAMIVMGIISNSPLWFFLFLLRRSYFDDGYAPRR